MEGPSQEKKNVPKTPEKGKLGKLARVIALGAYTATMGSGITNKHETDPAPILKVESNVAKKSDREDIVVGAREYAKKWRLSKNIEDNRTGLFEAAETMKAEVAEDESTGMGTKSQSKQEKEKK